MRVCAIILICVVFTGVSYAAEDELTTLVARAHTLREQTLQALTDELDCQQLDVDNCRRLLSILCRVSFEIHNLEGCRFRMYAHKYHEALQEHGLGS